MAAVICIVLGCLCLWLGLQVYTARRGLRGAARQLRELEETGSRVRLRLDAPSAPAEELLDAINALLDLRQQEQAAYRARERDLRRQISNVSHDLRTPLTSILGYLQLLEGDNLTPQERHAIGSIDGMLRISGGIEDAQDLIQDFEQALEAAYR